MDAAELTALARAVAAGDMTPEQLVERARLDTVTDLGYAQIDTERGVRTGVSEVIYGAGKTAEQIAGIVDAMRAVGAVMSPDLKETARGGLAATETARRLTICLKS